MKEPYQQGEVGIDNCPEGYQTITDPTECKTASQNLGLVHREDQNIVHADAICNFRGGCSPAGTRLDETHGILARWVCKLSD